MCIIVELTRSSLVSVPYYYATHISQQNFSEKYNNTAPQIASTISEANGIYFVEIATSEGNSSTLKLVKN